MEDTMDSLEICYMSAVEMAEAVKSRKLSPVEIMDAVLSRIERLNPKVNAYCTLLAESATKQAGEAENIIMKGEELGPLHGVPFSIKDLTFTKGIRTTFGSKIYENFIPDKDAIVVERLRAAGAIMLGKTNTPEFGFMGVTDNLIFGPTHNPWNLQRHAGGSSGGAAASVAAGMGPLAQGSDGGGSIRIPSSFCGVFGIKPSFGRVPRGPGFLDWMTLSHFGPITRTVRDAALAMEVMAGIDYRDRHSLPDTNLRYLSSLDGDLKGLRVAWSPDLGYAVVDPQVLAATSAAVSTFETLGCTVDAATPEVENPGRAFAFTWAVKFASSYLDKLDEWRDQMNPALVDIIERGKDRTALEYARSALEREEYCDRMLSFFENYDLLLTPSTAVPAFDIDKFEVTEIGGIKGSPTLEWTPFTYPFNFTGQPAASVPCGWTDDGLPVGLQIVGRRFEDLTVLRAAAAFEQASPWADRRPPLD
jgi:aspartyl-tRNA(Asn)/glutamyl-tRNA(Gln) amidotransferase subunit A